MAQTKAEYIANLQQQVKHTETFKNHRVLGRKILYAMGILAIAGVVSAGGMVISSTTADKAYQTLSDEGFVDYEFLNYKDTFNIWNNTKLGNDINVLLSGGKVCLKDGSVAMSVKPQQGQAIVISGASYINKHGDDYIYRDDHSRKMVAMNANNQQRRVLFDGNVGEVICEGNDVYFINLGDESNVYRLKLEEGRELEKVVAEPVQSFVSVNGSILYLTTNGSLYVKLRGKNVATLLSEHIERFFIAGNILAESQDKIVSFTPMGNAASLVYQSENQDMRMIGFAQGNIYLQENGQLLELSNGKKTTLIDTAHSLYSSLTFDGEGKGVVYEQNQDEKGNIIEAVVSVVKGAK